MKSEKASSAGSFLVLAFSLALSSASIIASQEPSSRIATVITCMGQTIETSALRVGGEKGWYNYAPFWRIQLSSGHYYEVDADDLLSALITAPADDPISNPCLVKLTSIRGKEPIEGISPVAEVIFLLSDTIDIGQLSKYFRNDGPYKGSVKIKEENGKRYLIANLSQIRSIKFHPSVE